MVMESLLRFLGLKSGKQKQEGVYGGKVQVEFFANPDNSSISYPTEAIYIPRNLDHRMSRPFAERVGLQFDREKGRTIAAYWRVCSSSNPYLCRYEIMIIEVLPQGVDVVFGHHDVQGMLPNFPSPFDGVTLHKLPKAFDFSTPRTQRTGSMKKLAETRRRLTWPFVNPSKRSAHITKRSPSVRAKSRFTINDPAVSVQLQKKPVANPVEHQDPRPDDIERRPAIAGRSSNQVSKALAIPRGQTSPSSELKSGHKAHEVLQASSMLHKPSTLQTPKTLDTPSTLQTIDICRIPNTLHAPNTLITPGTVTTLALSLDMKSKSVERESCQSRRPNPSRSLPMVQDTSLFAPQKSQVTSTREEQEAINLIESRSLDSIMSPMNLQDVATTPLHSSDLRSEPQTTQEKPIAFSKLQRVYENDPRPVYATYTSTIRHEHDDPLLSPPLKRQISVPTRVGSMTDTTTEGIQDISNVNPTSGDIPEIEMPKIQMDLPKTKLLTAGTGDYIESLAFQTSRRSERRASSVIQAHKEKFIKSHRTMAYDSDSHVSTEYAAPLEYMGGNFALRDGTRSPGSVTAPGIETLLGQQTADMPVLNQQNIHAGPEDVQSSSHEPTKPLRNRRDLPVRAVRSTKAGASGSVNPAILQASNNYWTWEDASKLYYHIDSDTGSTQWYEDTEVDSDEELSLGEGEGGEAARQDSEPI